VFVYGINVLDGLSCANVSVPCVRSCPFLDSVLIYDKSRYSASFETSVPIGMLFSMIHFGTDDRFEARSYKIKDHVCKMHRLTKMYT